MYCYLFVQFSKYLKKQKSEFAKNMVCTGRREFVDFFMQYIIHMYINSNFV